MDEAGKAVFPQCNATAQPLLSSTGAPEAPHDTRAVLDKYVALQSVTFANRNMRIGWYGLSHGVCSQYQPITCNTFGVGHVLLTIVRRGIVIWRISLQRREHASMRDRAVHAPKHADLLSQLQSNQCKTRVRAVD